MTAPALLSQPIPLIRYPGGRWQLPGWDGRGPYVTDEDVKAAVRAGQAEVVRWENGWAVEVRENG